MLPYILSFLYSDLSTAPVSPLSTGEVTQEKELENMNTADQIAYLAMKGLCTSVSCALVNQTLKIKVVKLVKISKCK